MVISEERLRTTEERLRSKEESSLLQVVVPPHAAIVNTNNNNNNNNNIEIVQESEGVPSAAVITIVKDQNQQNPLLWRGVVVLLCAVWASNFACAKIILAQPGMNPSLYAVARFAIAAISLLPGSIIAARQGKISQNTAISAIVCGIWVAFGYLGQTVGLMTTTPSRACVICSLNCIFVAIVSEYMRVNTNNIANTISINIDDRDNYDETTNNLKFNLMKLIPALIAVIGVAIIELKGAAGNPTIGDLICFSQPVGFGMGYLQLEQLMKKEPSAALPVSGIKLAVVALAALLLFESSSGGGWMVPDFTPILSSPVALRAICYTGIVTTSLALWVESIAFQRVKATDASIILTTEPLFAAATSAVLVGERFGVSDIIGAMFIVGACIFAIKMEDNSDSSTIEGSS
jgi:drug/metabolite transporter (DMT)-like permease